MHYKNKRKWRSQNRSRSRSRSRSRRRKTNRHQHTVIVKQKRNLMREILSLKKWITFLRAVLKVKRKEWVTSYIHTYIHTYIIHTYCTYIHTYTHTYIHIYIQIKAIREQPRADAEVERKEEKDIDKVFVESSSDDEEDLTETGYFSSFIKWVWICGN